MNPLIPLAQRQEGVVAGVPGNIATNGSVAPAALSGGQPPMTGYEIDGNGQLVGFRMGVTPPVKMNTFQIFSIPLDARPAAAQAFGIGGVSTIAAPIAVRPSATTPNGQGQQIIEQNMAGLRGTPLSSRGSRPPPVGVSTGAPSQYVRVQAVSRQAQDISKRPGDPLTSVVTLTYSGPVASLLAEIAYGQAYNASSPAKAFRDGVTDSLAVATSIPGSIAPGAYPVTVHIFDAVSGILLATASGGVITVTTGAGGALAPGTVVTFVNSAGDALGKATILSGGPVTYQVRQSFPGGTHDFGLDAKYITGVVSTVAGMGQDPLASPSSTRNGGVIGTLMSGIAISGMTDEQPRDSSPMTAPFLTKFSTWGQDDSARGPGPQITNI